MGKEKSYYLGLDIGTDSVGYAVTDEQYNLLKFKGEPAWGATIFDEGSLNEERRSHRSDRRRLDRRKQRIHLVEEIFALEVNKVDADFFKNLRRSYLFRDEADIPYTLFNDADFKDADYYYKYPTIHHLLYELMKDNKPHDVRLVYLACSWLVAHRGHFLSNIDVDNISEIKDFSSVYRDFINFFEINEKKIPWNDVDIDSLANVLKKKEGILNKNKEIINILLKGRKPDKKATEEFPFSEEGIIKLLAGGTYSLSDLFAKDEYCNLEQKTISLGMDDEKFEQLMADIGDDYGLIEALRKIYDWSLLTEILGESDSISQAKIKVYEQHKKDLELLKRIIRKYRSEKYAEVFRKIDKSKKNYVSYVCHSDEKERTDLKKSNKEDFSKYILAVVKDIIPDEIDEHDFKDMLSRLELRNFLPKQKETDNRVIPYQLYFYELKAIINNAKNYLKFLDDTDSDNISNADKLLSIFLFRIPYFVGPLNSYSSRSWFIRKAEGKIYPWNFESLVDLDASEEAFINKLTNTCTYLPGEPVVPKDSLIYHKFSVLNEINNIRINGDKISVELKQAIYNDLFMHKKKVTRKQIDNYLICNGVIKKGEENTISGIDINIYSNLSTQIAFRRLMESGQLTENDVERIVERSSYAEDKLRLGRWLITNYPSLSEEDRRYICSIKVKDFGRLSKYFLSGLEGIDKSTGELVTIVSAMWDNNYNLMEILSDDKFTFAEVLSTIREDYYLEHKKLLAERMDEMYLSNSVRRSIYRTLDIVNDVVKAFGKPTKVFVEMTRGGDVDEKGKRTKCRKEQILELYHLVQDEDVRILQKQLEEMGELGESKLRSDKLFLYYMQFGKCMYTGQHIDLEKLTSKAYDIDHIYPQAYVKDDSIINNKVLVLSSANGDKSDVYPIAESIRNKMRSFWSHLNKIGAISDEKYKRLLRSNPFTEEEKRNFINRQITETSQSTKAVATLLKEKYPNIEIVYSKARLTSEFRHDFGIYKSRAFNDLHHAVDAYLNVVVGNVYDNKFTKNFNVNTNYSIKTKTIFTHPLVVNGKTIWDAEMLGKVKKIATKYNAHFTKYSYFKKGGLFDQMPVKASAGLVPIKKGRDTAKYGGYNKAGAMFYIPVRYKTGKKTEILIMSVEMLFGNKFLHDEVFAREYSFARIQQITGKKAENVEFPMGMRPWKVNTMLSLDGFRVCISSISDGGMRFVVQPIMQFSESNDWVYYLSKLEKLSEHYKNNKNYVYSEDYDKVSLKKNVELYDLYIYKLRNSIYSKRINNPIETIESGRKEFIALSIEKQVAILLNIQAVFARASSVNLVDIGGKKDAAALKICSALSNLSKKYKDIRIIDSSAAGLWQKKSDNLLKLL